jgi:hypothetical protein
MRRLFSFPASLFPNSWVRLDVRRGVRFFTGHAAPVTTLAWGMALSMPAFAGTPTAATLTISSGGSRVTSVPSGTVVTLTATVTAGTALVSPGLVKFCDATAAYCEDIHILGTAQLTSAGTATFKFLPAAGGRSYKAVFVGTKSYAGSASSTAALSVTGSATVTSIAETGDEEEEGGELGWNLTATVSGAGSTPPTGTVSFIDAADGNTVLAMAALTAQPAGLTWSNPLGTVTNSTLAAIVVGDFNGDGIPDLAVACGGTNAEQDNGTVTVLLGNGKGAFQATAENPPTGVDPQALAVGDFNGDGNLDLAVANAGGTVTVLLGNGDGTFKASTVNLPTLSSPWAIVVGDFNGDGIPDLAVANIGNDSIAVLLGNGDGTFTATAVNPSTGGGSTGIAVADFNGDGIQDLAVVNTSDSTVTVLLGNGDGTFKATAVSPPTGGSPEAIVAADFNGDGIPDLAVACGGTNAEQDNGTVTVLLGKGDGTFAAAASPVTEGVYLSITTGDFNGDGIPDLAITNDYPIDGYRPLTDTVLLGKGDGTFASTMLTLAPSNDDLLTSPHIAAGDFTANGLSDLAVTSWLTTGGGLGKGAEVVVLIATGDQNATATATGVIVPLATGAGLLGASYPGDSNYTASTSTFPVISVPGNKGTPTVNLTSSASSVFHGAQVSFTATVAGVGFSPTGSVSFYDGSSLLGTGALSGGVASYSTSALSLGSHNITAGYSGDTDYNGSDTAVLVLEVIPAGDAITGTTLTVTSAGNPVTTVTSGSAVTLTTTVRENGSQVTSGTVTVCDGTITGFCSGLAGLGSAQLTSSGTAALTVRLGIGVHSLQAFFDGTTGTGASASPASPLTVTGERASVTTLTEVEGQPGYYQANVLGVGPEAAYSIPTGTVQFIDTSDSNNVLAIESFTSPFLYQEALFFPPPQSAATGTRPFSIATGDFNHDGIPDLALANSEGNTAGVLLGNGDGTFQTQTTYAVGNGAFAVAAGDFNGDGDLDLAVANFSDNTVSILLGNGDGTFQAQKTYATGGEPNAVEVGDFNGDGIPDLAVANNADGNVSIFLGKGDGTFRAQQTYATGNGPASIAVGDFNGDGILDLAVANNTDGTVGVLLGKGDGSFPAQVPYPVGKDPISVIASELGSTHIAGGTGLTVLGNGILDLAVANLSGNTISVLPGNGDGTFQSQVTTPSGTDGSPYAVVAGNFCGKGTDDLAVMNSSNNTVRIMKNTGGGNFAEQNQFSTGAGPISAAVADFNGDGLPDLAVLNNTAGTVTVLLNESGFRGQTAALDLDMPGSHLVEAVYRGDKNYNASTSSAVRVTGANATTTLTLGSSNGNPSNYGNAVTLTATLNPSSVYDVSSNGGTVIFQFGSTMLGTGTLVSGVATLKTSVLPVGSDSILATFSAFNGFNASTSNTFSQTVRPATLTVNGPDVSRAYGAPNPPLTGTVSGAVNGDTFTVTATTKATESSPVASYPVVPTASGAHIADYNLVTVDGTLTVTQATPIITWAMPAAITYGTALSATQLDATTSLLGKFAFSPTSGTVLPVGPQTLSVTFTPTDTTDYTTVKTTASLTVLPTPAVLTSPTPGGTLAGTSATFSWTAGGGVSKYKLRLGTTGLGSKDVYNAADVTTTSLSSPLITNIPAYGVTLYARLYSFINGVAQYNDYTYTESGSPVKAVLISPTPGSKLTGSSATFTWSAGGGVTQYEFRLGTTGPGSKDVYNSAEATTSVLTTGVVSNIPTYGQTLYARIYSWISGAWQYNDYTYTAQ